MNVIAYIKNREGQMKEIKSYSEWTKKVEAISYDEALKLGIVKEFNENDVKRDDDEVFEVYAHSGTTETISEVAKKHGLNIATYTIEGDSFCYSNTKRTVNRESYFLTRNFNENIFFSEEMDD